MTAGSSGRAEVEAVRDREWPRHRSPCDIAGTRLGEGQLRSGVRIQPVYRPLPSIEIRHAPRRVVGRGEPFRRSPAALDTVLPSTYRSYWSVIQDLSARPGDAASCCTVARNQIPRVRAGQSAPVWHN